jgi:endonuclease YncB( thermonuclease family)
MVWKLRFAFAALLCWPIAAGGADLTGRASVIDGDTLHIHDQRIRLHGIDAPEARQTCEADGQTYRCGHQAALALADHIGQGTVVCDGRDLDRYGWVMAVCHLGAEELNALARIARPAARLSTVRDGLRRRGRRGACGSPRHLATH